MKFSHLQTFRSPKTGKYRVMIVGQPDSHIMDWRGCNFRRMSLPTHLQKTFTKATEAVEYEKHLEKTEEKTLIHVARICGDGSWFDQREGVYVTDDLLQYPDAPSKGWLKNICQGECKRQLQTFSKTCPYCSGPVLKVLEQDRDKVMA